MWVVQLRQSPKWSPIVFTVLYGTHYSLSLKIDVNSVWIPYRFYADFFVGFFLLIALLFTQTPKSTGLLTFNKSRHFWTVLVIMAWSRAIPDRASIRPVISTSTRCSTTCPTMVVTFSSFSVCSSASTWSTCCWSTVSAWKPIWLVFERHNSIRHAYLLPLNDQLISTFSLSDSANHHRRSDTDLVPSALDLRTSPVQRSAGHALLLRCR